MLSPILLVSALAVFLSACAGPTLSPAPVMKLNPKGCHATWDLASSQQIELDSPGGAHSFRVDGDVRCLAQSGKGSVSYAVYRLPRSSEPWTLLIESRISEGSLFAPEGLLLNGEGNVLREIPFERFAKRGNGLQTTVFFGPDNAAEEYLLIHSAGAIVGSQERHIVSGKFTIPILTGALPFLYMQGTEAEGIFAYTNRGVVYLRARSAAYAPMRRHTPGER